MNILLVDDEQLALAELEDVTREIMPKAWISCVDNYVDALATSEQTRFDVAILDIEMPGMNVIELAKRMKQSNSDINILFSTALLVYPVLFKLSRLFPLFLFINFLCNFGTFYGTIESSYSVNGGILP